MASGHIFILVTMQENKQFIIRIGALLIGEKKLGANELFVTKMLYIFGGDRVN